MASVRARKDNGLLLIDFRYRGERCREQTLLPDTAANRTRLESLAARIERAINSGAFRYADYFPNSRRARDESSEITPEGPSTPTERPDIPTFGDFAKQCIKESAPRWRKRYLLEITHLVERTLIPRFGEKRLDQISKADVLAFRADLAQRPGRGGQKMSARRINKVVMQFKAILNEGCERYELPSPARGLKALKQKRSDVKPFSLEEVEVLIATVRDDYRPYLTLRCFTGLRTAEANGLYWSDIDFDRNVIRVERTLSRNGDGELKTESSRRDVPMVPVVRQALEQQREQRVAGSELVFHSPGGKPIDEVNFTNRVWYPLLRHIGLSKRPPYQMRHTAATLMLGSGENPEWVARVLGHANTDMLFRVYSRFVPNLTRQDGRAFAGLINSRAASTATGEMKTSEQVDAMDVDTLRRELKAMLSAKHRARAADRDTHGSRNE